MLWNTKAGGRVLDKAHVKFCLDFLIRSIFHALDRGMRQAVFFPGARVLARLCQGECIIVG